MLSLLRRFRRVVVYCVCIFASSGLRSQTAATTPAPSPAPSGNSVAAWLKRIAPLHYPDNINADWLSAPAAGPGVAAELANVLLENPSPTLRSHAAHALGELRRDPAIAIPALCRALADDDEGVRAQAVAAVRSFGGAAQAKLWETAADFRPVKTGASPPSRVSDFAVAALAGLEGLDPQPLFEEYRAAAKHGRWRERAKGDAATSDPNAEFLGSTEHLSGVLDAVFERVDNSTVTALGAFLADENASIRHWAQGALAHADDTSAVIPQTRARWTSADTREKEGLVAIFAGGGTTALTDLIKLADDSSVSAATRGDVDDAIGNILAAQPLAELLDEWRRQENPNQKGRLLEVIIGRAAQGGAPDAWQPAIVEIANEALSDPKTREAALTVLGGAIRVSVDGRLKPAGGKPQLDLPAALASSLALAEVKLYPSFPAGQQRDLLAAIGILKAAAHSEALVDALRKIFAGAEGESRETAMLVLTAIGAPPPDLVKWLATADPGSFGELLPLLDAASETGAAALTEIVRRGATDEEIAARFSSPALWRLIAASKDPADTARRLRPMAGGEQLQADVSAVLAEHGSDAERGEACKKLTADELAFAIMRWDYKLAETVLRRGDAEAKNEAIKELVDQRDPRLPAIIREAMKHRDDDFPWVDKLIAAMPDMRAGYFHDAQRLLLESDQGRAALVKAVTANPDFMLRALEHLDEVPVKSAQVIAAVQKIAQHPDNEDGGFALAALARLASADPQTHAVWIAALSADDKETRGKAIDALEQAATQEPALHPLWMAAAMRERGLKEMASHLDAGRTKQDDAFAAWKAAQPKPAAAVAQAGAQPAAGAGAWRVPVADMQKAANDPIHAPDLAREAATAHPADAVAIAASFAVAAPAAAPQIAGAVAATQPERAEIVAAAVALSTPFQAVAIAAGVAQTFPQKAAVIAAAVAAVMPAARAAIINAVAEATHQAPESVEQQVAAAAGSVNAVAAAALTAVSASGYGQNTQTAAPPPATSASAGPPVSAAMEEFQQFAFPWPPPPPVVWDTFRDGPNEPLNRRWLGDDNTTLEEVNRRLRAALRAISPDFVSGLFPVPGGFALVTRIERIHRNGEPFHGDMRWSDGNSLKPDWPTYMFYERSGYLRKIVFAVTTDANIRPVAGRKIPPPESGAQNLPGEVGRLTLKDRYVHVLVYAFEKIPEGSFVAFTELSAPRHVETTGLLTYFQPPPHR